MSTAAEADPITVAVSENEIKNHIYVIRGQQVMLDYELAKIYGYETKAFNQQVKRNIERFPDDFMFRLSSDEWDILRSQNVSSSWGGTRYLPYAFTEQGIYMLMTVLKGSLAVSQSTALIRIFKKMKDYIVSEQPVIGSSILETLALQTNQNTKAIAEIKENMISKADLPEIIKSFGFSESQTEHLILNNEIVEAGLAYKQIYRQAASSIYIIDNYIGLKTLYLLNDVKNDINIIIFSDNLGNSLTCKEYLDFNHQYGINVRFKKTLGAFHDRYIVLDYGQTSEKIYHCGASSKDAGKKITTISLLSDITAYRDMVSNILNNPDLDLR